MSPWPLVGTFAGNGPDGSSPPHDQHPRARKSPATATAASAEPDDVQDGQLPGPDILALKVVGIPLAGQSPTVGRGVEEVPDRFLRARSSARTFAGPTARRRPQW